MREDPNLLEPGDVVQVKLLEIKVKSCASDARHSFIRKGIPEKLILVFKIDVEPRANESFLLVIDGASSEGQTDAEGRVEIGISPTAKQGHIIFSESGDKYDLQLGHLDPIDTVKGAQGCLKNLGYYKGNISGKMNQKLISAIKYFQIDNDIVETGELDSQTTDKLKSAYA